MSCLTQNIDALGFGEIEILYDNGDMELIPFENSVVNDGRLALTKSLANQYGGIYEFWVSEMVFGTGGATGGVPKYVDASRTGLWGPQVASKPVIATINPSLPNQVAFTSVLLFTDAVGDTINEMGLVLRNGQFFSITTFGGIAKTSGMQLTIRWKITFT